MVVLRERSAISWHTIQIGTLHIHYPHITRFPPVATLDIFAIRK